MGSVNICLAKNPKKKNNECDCPTVKLDFGWVGFMRFGLSESR